LRAVMSVTTPTCTVSAYAGSLRMADAECNPLAAASTAAWELPSAPHENFPKR
jgi:hypothetical protein